MSLKFYQFDYAEMKGFEINSMGILNIHSDKGITSENLKDFARKHLKQPNAHIVISNIAKLTKNEFEKMTGGKI